MSEPKLFRAAINEEGPSKTKRGKIPAGLINMLGGEKGDFLELEVSGKFITGGRIVRGKEAQKIWDSGENLTQSRVAKPSKSKAAKAVAKKAVPEKKVVKKTARPTKKATPVKKTKPVAPKAPAKPVKKAAKPTKRKTSVAYEKPKVKRPTGSKK